MDIRKQKLKEYRKKYFAMYYEKHKQTIQAKNKVSSKEYYYENIDKCATYAKKYYEKNTDYYKNYSKQYKLKHSEKKMEKPIPVQLKQVKFDNKLFVEFDD